jgi:hypothetical protein
LGVKSAELSAEKGRMAAAEDFTRNEGLAVPDALDQLEDLTREELEIRAWRFTQLVAHGYEIQDALEVAWAVDIDLELARTLVAVHGCSSELAVRILL